MTNKPYLLYSVICCMTGSFIFAGCIEQKQKPTPSIEILSLDTTVHLLGDPQSPGCKMSIEYAYLKPAEQSDSISASISNLLQKAVLGEQYANIPVQEAINAFKDNYTQRYIKDVEPLYQSELKKKKDKEDLPSWYNYEYSLTTDLKKGKDGVWNYTCTTFEYTGGAHPNTRIKWFNIEEQSGKLLEKADVFAAGKDKEICALLMPKLMEYVNEKMDTDTISTLEGLQNAGVLMDTDLFVPDNFLLSEEGVSFLYNQYDIAPYSMGCITLTLPYEDINAYLIK